jgi:hypothetical protein
MSAFTSSLSNCPLYPLKVTVNAKSSMGNIATSQQIEFVTGSGTTQPNVSNFAQTLSSHTGKNHFRATGKLIASESADFDKTSKCHDHGSVDLGFAQI